MKAKCVRLEEWERTETAKKGRRKSGPKDGTRKKCMGDQSDRGAPLSPSVGPVNQSLHFPPVLLSAMTQLNHSRWQQGRPRLPSVLPAERPDRLHCTMSNQRHQIMVLSERNIKLRFRSYLERLGWSLVFETNRLKLVQKRTWSVTSLAMSGHKYRCHTRANVRRELRCPSHLQIMTIPEHLPFISSSDAHLNNKSWFIMKPHDFHSFTICDAVVAFSWYQQMACELDRSQNYH